MGFRENALSAKDPLPQCLLRHQEGKGNLGCGEAADQTQRQCDASFNCEDWMASGKDEAQDVIIDDLVQCLIGAPVDGGSSPSSASSTPAFCRLLLYSIILATASALGTASGAAISYPLGNHHHHEAH